jgi:hypothetical protein
MFYIYDEDGFLSGTTEDGETPRSTQITPTDNENNFVGGRWVYVSQEDFLQNKENQRLGSIEEFRKNTILSKILELESQITNRRLREASYSQEGKDWVIAKDLEIAALRAQL